MDEYLEITIKFGLAVFILFFLTHDLTKHAIKVIKGAAVTLQSRLKDDA